MAKILAWLSGKQSEHADEASSADGGSGENDVVPGVEEYLLDAGMATITTLQTLSALAPPLSVVSPVLELAVRIVRTCETISQIKGEIEQLQRRVCSLGVLVVNKSQQQQQLPSNGGSDPDFDETIKTLQSTLNSVVKDLETIKRQNKWLLIIWPDLNRGKVVKRMGDLDYALQTYFVSHNVRVAEVLTSLRSTMNRVDENVIIMKDQVQRLMDCTQTQQPHCSESTGKDDIPTNFDTFYGRVDDVATIVQCLTDQHNGNDSRQHVWINGPPGIGKTSLALELIRHPAVVKTFGKYRFWVPCTKVMSHQHFIRILYTQLSITARSYDGLETLIDELSATNDRRLVLLDHFETVWDLDGVDESQSRVQGILSRLASLPNVTLLVTITSSQPPPKHPRFQWLDTKLDVLDSEFAVEVFNFHYEGQNREEVKSLLDKVDRIPLLIKLMAIDARNSKMSIADLAEEQGNGRSTSMDNRIKSSFDVILRDSNPEVLELFAVLSMLPAGTTFDRLGKIWAPTRTDPTTGQQKTIATSSNVSSLQSSAFLVNLKATDKSESNKLLLFAIFRKYIRQHNMVSREVKRHVLDACYEYVTKRRSHPDDAHFKSYISELASEEDNIICLLQETDSSAPDPKRRAQALVGFSYYLSKKKQSVECARVARDAAHAAKDDRSLAQALVLLGKLCHRVAKYDEACEHFVGAQSIFADKLGDKAHAAECLLDLVRTWRYMEKGTKSISEMKKITEKANKMLTSTKPKPNSKEAKKGAGQSKDGTDEVNRYRYNVARGKLGLGRHYLYTQDWQKAKVFFEDALAVFQELNNSGSTSECLHNLAKIEATSKANYQRAIELARQALVAADESGEDTLVTYAFELLACYYLITRDYKSATDVLLESIPKTISLGDLLIISRVNEQLAYLYAAVAQRDKAVKCYDESRVGFGKIQGTPGGRAGRARCERNLEVLRREPFHFEQIELNRF
ncbi:hypothetical protein JR316_0001761 [Psilocybe cubensis]|uniref:Uncharacterized protein n=2 Tax=Psilocybe cubensis TaxID=181762 RepID=A0ACB8HB05_PSICU|nr:hypothetical protein JR316_0001761 [Psilocybe cubensis]KAH9484859.1 hypothetical protein JR316_0001761 [Psilocybe cubensis]